MLKDLMQKLLLSDRNPPQQRLFHQVRKHIRKE